jgi:UDP-GlcNAc:undecaprenyl-phosphate GlcNAc-1-phosphate transferase
MQMMLANMLAMVEPTASADQSITRLDMFHRYIWVLLVAFVVTIFATPIMRRLAVKHGVIDRPSEARKIHKMPIAYLGGVAVFGGILAGIFYSYLGAAYPELLDYQGIRQMEFSAEQEPVPLSVLLGMTIIAVVGLIDDVTGIDPRVKVGGQLIAAAALAMDEVGVKVAAGAVLPIAHAVGIPVTVLPSGLETIQFTLIPGLPPVDAVYWLGTAVIGFCVVGACNASNLVDGLDGLLSGTTAIAAAGLLVIALTLAVQHDGPRDSQRIVLCMAVLGACLGFLPHNFNPATIFLGDCGSLMLGFCTIVIILSLGDTGKTHLVLAGLVIYAIPLIDTSLAIIRRKMAGKRISDPDSDHLHHIFKRALGVKGAALALYGIGACFATLGILMSLWRQRVVYALLAILVGYIAVIAIKIARRKQIEEQALAFDAKRAEAAVIQAAAQPAVESQASVQADPEPAARGS